MTIRRNSSAPASTNIGLSSGKTLSGADKQFPPSWKRPADWLVLPTVTETDEKFVGLHAVYPSANFLALSASGDYTVDWGDGVVENFAAGVTAQHEYNYSTYDVLNTTLTSKGYKQAIVVVTPQSGQSLTSLDLHKRHSSLAVSYNSGFLDIILSGPNLTFLLLGSSSFTSATININFKSLEQVSIINSNLKTLSNLFLNCSVLQSVPVLKFNETASRSLSVTFTDATELVTSAGHGLSNGDGIILETLVSTTGITTGSFYFVVNATTDTFQISTSYGGAITSFTTNGSGTFLAGVTLGSLFNGCTALQKIPLFDTANVVSFSGTFNGCRSLVEVPCFDTSSTVSMASMFATCPALKVVPLFNTPKLVTTSGMFSGCTALQTVPLFNTANVTNMSVMFQSCLSLQTVPLFNTANVTNMGNMFQNCTALQTVPLFDTTNVTTMSSMFQGSSSLQTVPLFNTANVTNMSSMFNTCTGLAEVPALNTTAVSSSTNFNTMFSGCSSLSRIQAKDFRFTFSVASCKLSATALNEIYTNLPTVTAQTITVTGNYGTTSDTPSIATAKGWTVTG